MNLISRLWAEVLLRYLGNYSVAFKAPGCSSLSKPKRDH